MLKAAYDSAAIYFPFTDLIVADPYRDMTDGLRLAFVVGQSKVVGHITTDIIELATDTLQVQMWIGSTDHLPRSSSQSPRMVIGLIVGMLVADGGTEGSGRADAGFKVRKGQAYASTSGEARRSQSQRPDGRKAA
jgi:hypothetical protein